MLSFLTLEILENFCYTLLSSRASLVLEWRRMSVQDDYFSLPCIRASDKLLYDIIFFSSSNHSPLCRRKKSFLFYQPLRALV
jgi:hypothetical protein